MKNWLTYIFLWMAGTLGMLTTSCSQEDENLDKVLSSDGKVTIEFSISLGNSGTGSRASWGDQPYDDDPNIADEDEIGDTFENTIYLDQFHVNLILSNDEIIPIQGIFQPDATNEPYTFKGEVKVRSPKDLTGARIEVRANIGEDDTFETNYTTRPGVGVQYIPMWGVYTITATDVQNLLLTASSTLNIANPIQLLRAMAKIEVVLHEDLIKEGYTLDGIGLNKYNSMGNLLPTAAGDEEYTTDYDREACINAYTDANNSSIVSSSDYTGLPFQLAPDKTSSMIYLPEYDNTANDLAFKITIHKGDVNITEQLGTKGVCNHVGHLIRNHWYKYTITKVNMDTDIEFELKYQVMDWTEIDNDDLYFGNGDGDVFDENGDNE